MQFNFVHKIFTHLSCSVPVILEHVTLILIEISSFQWTLYNLAEKKIHVFSFSFNYSKRVLLISFYVRCY